MSTRVTQILPPGGPGTSDAAAAAGVIDSLIEQLGRIGSGALDIAKQFFQLPLANPTMAAVLGILVNDILSHRVNWVQWTHEEQYCQDCNTFVSIYEWVTGSHVNHQYVTMTLPGIITGAANLQIAGIILTSFGVAEAGQILQDITNITKISGSTPVPSVTAPTVTTLVNAGTPITIGKEKVTNS